jgi:mono/diheme cytochrome c family protein
MIHRLLVLGAILLVAASAGADDGLETGEAVYGAACSTCHGSGGRGAPASLVGFSDPVPDFTDCDFANREPDSDWVGIAYEGGPSRGFSEKMPAFKGTLSVEQVRLAVNHIRTFCADDRWPRGELNLPRALITGKAYPEDEAVITTLIDAEG